MIEDNGKMRFIEEDDGRIGFGGGKKPETIYDQFRGKEVCIGTNGRISYGVFRGFVEGHAILQPSLVRTPAGLGIHLEKELPTLVPLPIGPISALPDNSMQEFVKEIELKNSPLFLPKDLLKTSIEPQNPDQYHP